ncbi:putative ABC transporter permease [Neobacillus cucumis]|uniref:putative ABC transporter permease n=1 Tax=Neobacillus cucumis TaxID=1740721 RepID=UPI0020403977|nr:putative ABC transporter permease [Neobacillus cucumis]MCM3727660.1 putative ABC transporter permease [Neobacillus cucumis]
MTHSWLKGLELQFVEVLTMEGAAAILFYFTFYSFIGWLLENSYNYVTKREFFKENFLFGPFKPMYGMAPVLLVYLTPQGSHWLYVLSLCFIIPTLVEYASGSLLQKLFQRQWWDYSETRFQLHGHICLHFSICWGFLSLLCIKWIHPGIISLYGSIEPLWTWIWSAVGLYFLADLALTIRKHTLQEIVGA